MPSGAAMITAEMRPDSIQVIFSDLGGTSRALNVSRTSTLGEAQADICAAFGIDFPGRIVLLVAHNGLHIAE